MCGTFSSENGQMEVVLGALLSRMICGSRRRNIFGRLVRSNSLCSMNQFQNTLKTILFCSAHGTWFSAFVTV